jgi:PilZ domain
MSRLWNLTGAEQQLASWRILEHVRAERRRVERRVVHIPARIDLGDSVLRDCTVLDISELGAKLEVKAPRDLPDTFTLFLAPNGYHPRRCRVSWRSDEHVGVEFVTAQSSALHGDPQVFE